MGFSYLLKYEQGGEVKKAIEREKNKIEKVLAEKNMPFHNFLILCRKLYVFLFFFKIKELNTFTLFSYSIQYCEYETC